MCLVSKEIFELACLVSKFKASIANLVLIYNFLEWSVYNVLIFVLVIGVLKCEILLWSVVLCVIVIEKFSCMQGLQLSCHKTI